MAQIDTGLGWSLKDTYASVSAGVIAGFNKLLPQSPITGQPLPHVAGQSELGQRGYVYNQAINTEKTGARTDDDIFVFYYPTSANNFAFVWVSASSSAKFCTGIASGATGIIVYREWTTSSYHSASGLYYHAITGSGTSGPQCPQFASLDEGMSNFSYETVTFEKVNDGYTATCVAKWKTPTEAIFESPILISTESEYTDMTTTQSGISLSKLNVLYNGRKFYMAFFDRPFDGNLTTSFPVIDRSYSDAPTFTLEELFKYIAKDVYANIIVTNAPDPYQEESGESGEAGGDGETDETDDVDFTDPPSTSIGATGLLTIFCPNLYQLQSLGSYMWSTFDVDNWRKIIANPMDAILGLHTLPIPAVITGTKAVKVAGIDTTIDMSYTTVRYIRRSMGTCEIPKKWGAYLDYSPYTKISIFLPFIGFKELDADDIMGKTIALQYMIDILTGACVAELKCGDTILYSWSGNCANEVPISGSDWRGAIASAISIAATVAGTALVTGGATAPMAASMVASVGANSMNLKPTINRSGAISGSAGYMSQKRPYIIRSIPNLVIPTDQNKFIGYPSFVTASLGSLTGYNEIASIHLEGIPATGNELAEIETLLKGGVIF